MNLPLSDDSVAKTDTEDMFRMDCAAQGFTNKGKVRLPKAYIIR